MASYVARHARRSLPRSFFSFALSLLLTGTISQLLVMRHNYAGIYDGMEIRARIIEGIDVKGAYELSMLEYVASLYYENSFTLICNRSFITVVMTNDIDRFSLGEVAVEFLDGYSNASFHEVTRASDQESRICVIDSGLMESLDVGLGETLVVQTMHGSAFDDLTNRGSASFTVVGCAIGNARCDIFVPVSNYLSPLLWSEEMVFDFVECSLLSPHYVDDFTAFLDEWGTTSMLSVITLDTDEAVNISRMLNLLGGLIPFALATTILIGGLVSFFIVMHRNSEASIMRSLGTTKMRVRTVLIVEQAMLHLCGLLCTAGLLFAINGSLPLETIASVAPLAALQFASCVAGAATCSVIITRRAVLALLHVKE